LRSLTAEELRRKVRGAKARKAGDTLEELTLRYLVARGVLAQRIATPCAVVGGRKRYLAKVVGDLIGVGVEGRTVLVECKRRTDGGVPRRPVPSDFQPHQRETLAAWHRAGAVVLVSYFNSSTVLTVEPAADIIATKGNK